jgi:hypothetical protein
VLAVHTGCGCLALRDLPAVLPEGARGSARAVLAAPNEPGPVDASVRVVLDLPPPEDVLRVRLVAYVGRTVAVRPGWLDLGRRPVGARVSSRLDVHVPPGADPEGVVAEVTDWPGTVRLEPAAFAGRRGPDLVLESVVPARPGRVVGALRVRTRDAGEVVVALRAEAVEPPVPRQAPAGP